MPWRHPAHLLCAVLVPTVVATLMVASGASAATWTHRDSAGDVASYSQVGESTTVEPSRADRRTDIRRVTIRHSQKLVRVVATMRDIERGNHMGMFTIETSSGGVSYIEVARQDGKVELNLQPLTEEQRHACRGASGRISTAADTIAITVTRACLDHPEWVRATVTTATWDGDLNMATRFNFDDGLRGLSLRKQINPARSPRVFVGRPI